MARKTKAQIIAALNASEAQPQAMDEAAAAFFASRLILAQPDAEPQEPQQEPQEPQEEISDEDIAAQQKAAEQAYENAIESAMKAADAAAPARGAAKPYIRSSSIAKPTKKVWAIADAMIAHAEESELPIPSRGEIIAECIARGIASGTSATQYQAWKKANGR
jgi:hypothetical protein